MTFLDRILEAEETADTAALASLAAELAAHPPGVPSWRTLSNYAHSRGRAIEARLDGRVRVALALEEAAEGAYRKLPLAERW